MTRRRSARLVAALTAISLSPLPSLAQTFALPEHVPVPRPRPTLSGAASGTPMQAAPAVDPWRFGREVTVTPTFRPQAAMQPAVDTSVSAFTASIARLPTAMKAIAPRSGSLQEGLQALSDRNPTRARAIREGMTPGSLDQKILQWAIASSGQEGIPAAEIAAAARELANWPGTDELRELSEAALLREDHSAREIVAAFSSGVPVSPEGRIALAEAWLALGDAGRAKALAVKVWREDRFDRDLERQILKSFGTLLTRADHKRRMDMLLYAERVSDAERVAKAAGAQSLFAARAAVIRDESNAGKRLAQVPPSGRADPSYRLALIEHYRKTDRVREAAKLLMEAPRDRETLVDPDAWWNERRIVARDLLDLGETSLAYRVASSHAAESAEEEVEAEFHAGWIALRFLNDARTAATHFSRILQISERPLSRSRGYYWLGRAAEAGGGGDAGRYYASAASFPGTYYGQLAAARLSRNIGPIAFPEPTAADRQRFAAREPVRAIQRLQEIGSDWRTDTLYRELADELDSPGELALLSVMAERRGDHHLVLQVGKRAYWRGVDAPALAFPVGVIPASANISAAGKALAYAIARQESAFNPAARSHAGALGLLQLMPRTAQAVARRSGLPYSEARLTSDPAYNATLGAQFLGEQIRDFAGSYVLTFAAYNAGPRRAREWIERFGDPRGRSLEEVIDWVERIPFTETRNYVQRVMENYQVYKVRLGAGFDIERDLRFGRGASG